jgi:hypothetical protein
MAGLGEQILNKIIDGAIDRALLPKRKTQADAIDKRIEHLDSVIAKLGSAESPNQPTSAEHTQISRPNPVITREGLDLGTLAYQEQKAYNELWLAESHAKEDFVGCATDVHCGFKHGLNLVALAQETKSMTTDPVWDEIEQLGWELQQRAHPDRVRERTHHQEYQELAIKISKPRREIQKRIMAKYKPAISLEEAKKLAAQEAEREIERRWV